MSYGRAGVLEAPSHPMLVIGRSFDEEMVVAEDGITEMIVGVIGIVEGEIAEDGITVEGITVGTGIMGD